MRHKWRFHCTLVTPPVISSLIVMAALSGVTSQAYAWGHPPDGPAPDQATPVTDPSTVLNQTKAHGYILQNGISILYNDGYWFAAQRSDNGSKNS